jgi:hypothetical protein
MATKQQIIDYLTANPNLSDAELVAYMAQNQISPAQLAEASGAPVGQISAQIGATIPPNQAVLLGDTWIQPQYQTYGSGESEVIGPLENVQVYKTTGGKNDQVAIGTDVQNFSPSGEYLNTFKTQKTESGFGEFLAGAGLLFGLPGLLNAGGGVAGAAGTAGMSAAELAQLDLALGGAGGSAGATSLANALATGANVGTLTNLTGGSGAGLLSGAGSTLSNAAGTIGSTLGNVAGSIGTTLGNVGGNIGSTLGNIATTIGGAGTDLITKVGTGIGTNLLTNAGTKLLGDAVTGGLGLAGGVLQSQESRDAATTAAQNVNTATQAAVAGSQFRPVGMTTRFGTSQYKYDPVTGQMISAGYQLTPEAKAQQDRFATMANYSLTQAENAQSQFAPLQTGAANLFGLGNQYISQSPQDVAQRYINQQMQLLQPSREMELANLQNRLQQQGRAGLSVAQGGTLGATTPELQALYNARAQQELQLAANAQREGQQNTLFGAGLLGQGSQALGQYFGGQVQAYQPYQAAMGQVQNLESLGQQPLQMGASLGQQSATAGANAGRIGLTGAQISGNLMTSPAVTNNPYAAFLGGLGSPTSTLGRGLANYFTGGGYVPPSTFSALGTGGFGTGNVFGNQDLGSFL